MRPEGEAITLRRSYDGHSQINVVSVNLWMSSWGCVHNGFGAIIILCVRAVLLVMRQFVLMLEQERCSLETWPDSVICIIWVSKLAAKAPPTSRNPDDLGDWGRRLRSV